VRRFVPDPRPKTKKSKPNLVLNSGNVDKSGKSPRVLQTHSITQQVGFKNPLSFSCNALFHLFLMKKSYLAVLQREQRWIMTLHQTYTFRSNWLEVAESIAYSSMPLVALIRAKNSGNPNLILGTIFIRNYL